MNNGLDLFDLNEPKDLYRIIHEVYGEYVDRPTERNFLFLVLGFTHLREWIAQSKHSDIERKQKNGEALTDGEKFYVEIYALPAFQVVQELCNRGKHHITRDAKATTSKMEGLRAGLGKAGDKLDQLYFLVDGQDSRDYFTELIRKYNEWFARGH
ncbi:hypothetical protein [Ralstonia insidiosa]|uniref:hypothetical protein n=1 Tax=Ralstonia insidiosa TaxID=190721 RepID=UPI000CEDBBD4|nr:hypothetical protein [Ralstonia insidiosa]